MSLVWLLKSHSLKVAKHRIQTSVYTNCTTAPNLNPIKKKQTCTIIYAHKYIKTGWVCVLTKCVPGYECDLFMLWLEQKHQLYRVTSVHIGNIHTSPAMKNTIINYNRALITLTHTLTVSCSLPRSYINYKVLFTCTVHNIIFQTPNTSLLINCIWDKRDLVFIWLIKWFS